MGRPRKTPVARSCAECGAAFNSAHDARFCCREHKAAWRDRMRARGQALAPYVMAWVEGRGGGHAGTHPVAGPAMREITSIARSFIDEDRAAGRPSTINYVEGLLAHGLYIDRKRN